MAQKKASVLTISPHEDYGFFGPESVAWKVWSCPTSLTVGFQRAVVIEELDPLLNAAVEATKAIRYRPRTRYERTLKYFALVAFGSTRETSRAADMLVKIHAKGVGLDPVTGREYDANNPASQLWIHLTAWHSILYAYEKYGPGRLSDEEEARYRHECAVAAELQTCDPADVPRSREAIRAWFDAVRPQLIASPVAQSTMRHLLNADVMFPPMPAVLRPLGWVVAFFLRAATIATMPHWMRDMAGLRQPVWLDALVVPVMRISVRLARLSTRAQLQILARIAPSVVPVAGPVLLRIPPKTKEVLTPAQARARYGYAPPSEAHQQWRQRQRDLVLVESSAPDESAMHESESILGSLA